MTAQLDLLSAKPEPKEPAGTPCALCGSAEGRPLGWAHVAAFTFAGRVHRVCYGRYREAKALWWEHHERPDLVLERLGWRGDASEKIFKVVDHLFRNSERLLGMMRETGWRP